MSAKTTLWVQYNNIYSLHLPQTHASIVITLLFKTVLRFSISYSDELRWMLFLVPLTIMMNSFLRKCEQLGYYYNGVWNWLLIIYDKVKSALRTIKWYWIKSGSQVLIREPVFFFNQQKKKRMRIISLLSISRSTLKSFANSNLALTIWCCGMHWVTAMRTTRDQDCRASRPRPARTPIPEPLERIANAFEGLLEIGRAKDKWF